MSVGRVAEVITKVMSCNLDYIGRVWGVRER